jgi:hypothetical protein
VVQAQKVRSNTSESERNAHTASIHQTTTTYHSQLKLPPRTYTPKPSNHTQTQTHPKMSFLFGQGRPQPSSAEKIAAAEAEIEMVSNMFNQ